MKKIFAVFIAMCMVFGVISVGLSAESGTTFTAWLPVGSPGDTVRAKIRVGSQEEMAAYHALLHYDKNVLQPISKSQQRDYFSQSGTVMDGWGLKMVVVKESEGHLSFVDGDLSTNAPFTGETEIITVDFVVLKEYTELPISLEIKEWVSWSEDGEPISRQDAATAVQTLVVNGFRIDVRKTIYEVGAAFDSTSLTVYETYTDGSEVDVTASATVTGFHSEQVGKYPVTVSYNGQSATFEVRIRPVGAGVLGDCTGDGVVNLSDVSSAALHAAGITILTGQGKENGDINMDGDVTLSDVSALALHVAGITLIQ